MSAPLHTEYTSHPEIPLQGMWEHCPPRYTLNTNIPHPEIPLDRAWKQNLPIPGWLLFVGCLTSQQQARVSQGRIRSDNSTCCHTGDRSCRSNFLAHPNNRIQTPGQPVPAVTLQRVAVCLFVGCLTSQQQASVSQGRICTDNFTCCHTETEVADPTFYLTQSQYTDTGPTSPSADPITPGARQSSHRSANV